MQGNAVRDDGAVALASMLETSACPLKTLGLGDNSIGDVGARALADALYRNTSVTSLALWNNQVAAGGADAESLGGRLDR